MVLNIRRFITSLQNFQVVLVELIVEFVVQDVCVSLVDSFIESVEQIFLNNMICLKVKCSG